MTHKKRSRLWVYINEPPFNPLMLSVIIGGVLVGIVTTFYLTSMPVSPTPAGGGSMKAMITPQVREHGQDVEGSGGEKVEQHQTERERDSAQIQERMHVEEQEAESSKQNPKKTGQQESGSGAEDPESTGSQEEEREDPQTPDKSEAQLFEEVKQKIKADWAKLLEVFESEGISVDLDKKRVEVKGAVIRDKMNPQYPFEYVVVSEGGSTHEAMILVRATPSNLNAALLALGLEPGKTISSKKKDPPPPQADIESGKESLYDIIPPKGTRIFIYVKYEGWTERPIRYLEDLMMDLRTGKAIERVGWIYVGSRFARVLQGRDRVVKYMADMERNIVACYLTGFGNAIFDINSLDGIYDTVYDLNPYEAPPMGAKVTLIFSLEPL